MPQNSMCVLRRRAVLLPLSYVAAAKTLGRGQQKEIKSRRLSRLAAAKMDDIQRTPMYRFKSRLRNQNLRAPSNAAAAHLSSHSVQGERWNFSRSGRLPLANPARPAWRFDRRIENV